MPVWTHFGFSEDDTEQKGKKTKKQLKRRNMLKNNFNAQNTTNLFQHLEDNHITEYEQCLTQCK